MTPPVEIFPASELPARVNTTSKGKRRKGESVDLHKCRLLEMLQYNCYVKDEKIRGSPIRCEPVERLFRRCVCFRGFLCAGWIALMLIDVARCADGMTVETTSWEGTTADTNGQR